MSTPSSSSYIDWVHNSMADYGRETTSDEQLLLNLSDWRNNTNLGDYDEFPTTFSAGIPSVETDGKLMAGRMQGMRAGKRRPTQRNRSAKNSKPQSSNNFRTSYRPDFQLTKAQEELEQLENKQRNKEQELEEAYAMIFRGTSIRNLTRRQRELIHEDKQNHLIEEIQDSWPGSQEISYDEYAEQYNPFFDKLDNTYLNVYPPDVEDDNDVTEAEVTTDGE